MPSRNSDRRPLSERLDLPTAETIRRSTLSVQLPKNPLPLEPKKEEPEQKRSLYRKAVPLNPGKKLIATVTLSGTGKLTLRKKNNKKDKIFLTEGTHYFYDDPSYPVTESGYGMTRQYLICQGGHPPSRLKVQILWEPQAKPVK